MSRDVRENSTGVLKNELRVWRLIRDLIVETLLGIDGSSKGVTRILVPDENLLVSSVIESGEDFEKKKKNASTSQETGSDLRMRARKELTKIVIVSVGRSEVQRLD